METRVFKLFRVTKEGKLHPLFINRKEETVLNKWLTAECYPTKGFAVRQGWHCCFKPYAPHLKDVLSNGEQRVWVECLAKDCETYARPESQGGTWVLAQQLKVLRVLDEVAVQEILAANGVS